MPQAQDVHPSFAVLEAFGLGRLDPRQQAEVERHIAGCDTCCDVLRVVRDDSLLAQLRQGHTMQASDDDRPGLTPPPGPAPDLPPELAGHPRYRIIKLLGAGGMGMVYQAEHRLMERPVALKVIGRELTSHPTAVERFRLEVKAAGKLAHPNIVTAYDADQASDLHFFVMEYVDGISLDRLVEKKGPLPVANACHYTRQAALGLQHAFEKGMVHRDIKPQNLMLTRKGQVKILDFGLARFAREHGATEFLGGVRPPSVPGLTQAGMVVGTPDYIAPEQAHDARKVDIRADVYGLGCTLYFLLAGHPPFADADSAWEKMLSHRDDDARPLTELRRDVPAELAAVVGRMMAKDPAQRYQTPTEAAQALTPFTKPGITPTPEAKPDQAALAARAAGEPDSRPAETLENAAVALTQEEPGPKARRARSRKRMPAKRGWPLVVVICFVAAAVVLAGTSYLATRLARNRGATGDQPRAPGTEQGVAREQPPGRKQARIAFILAANRFWYPDYAPVREALEAGGCEVQVVCWQAGQATPEINRLAGSRPVNVDVVLTQARVEQFDAVVVGGGPGALQEYLGGGPGANAAHQFLRDMHAANKVVAALCLGPPVLADAGLLRDRRATCLDNKTAKAKRLKADWVDEDVVVSGRIITARDDRVADKFARTILHHLKQQP